MSDILYLANQARRDFTIVTGKHTHAGVFRFGGASPASITAPSGKVLRIATFSSENAGEAHELTVDPTTLIAAVDVPAEAGPAAGEWTGSGGWTGHAIGIVAANNGFSGNRIYASLAIDADPLAPNRGRSISVSNSSDGETILITYLPATDAGIAQSIEYAPTGTITTTADITVNVTVTVGGTPTVYPITFAVAAGDTTAQWVPKLVAAANTDEDLRLVVFAANTSYPGFTLTRKVVGPATIAAAISGSAYGAVLGSSSATSGRYADPKDTTAQIVSALNADSRVAALASFAVTAGDGLAIPKVSASARLVGGADLGVVRQNDGACIDGTLLEDMTNPALLGVLISITPQKGSREWCGTVQVPAEFRAAEVGELSYYGLSTTPTGNVTDDSLTIPAAGFLSIIHPAQGVPLSTIALRTPRDLIIAPVNSAAGFDDQKAAVTIDVAVLLLEDA